MEKVGCMEAYIKNEGPYFEGLITYVREGRFRSLRSAIRTALFYEADFYSKMGKMGPVKRTERSATILKKLIIADGREVTPQQKINMTCVAVRHFVRDDREASNMRKKEERKPFWNSYLDKKREELKLGSPSQNTV